LPDAGRRRHSLDLVLRPVLRPRHIHYGVDYYFALTQTAINLQQNVSLPNNVTPQIQATSLVGEIYRYQVVGPPHFGLTNLRTVQDWILQRRLLTVPGVVQSTPGAARPRNTTSKSICTSSTPTASRCRR
jgi:hypothetical protein